MVMPTTAQNPAGSIRGKVTDVEGFPLPGASVYLRSPKILGMKTYITSDTGKFQFQTLLPSVYQLTVEMPGFKTAKLDDIVLHAGRSINLKIVLDMTEIEEEIALEMFIPSIEGEASRTATIIDNHMLRRIPFKRNLHDAVLSAPGVLPDLLSFPPAAVIAGASERDSLYVSDSLLLNDPMGNETQPRINFDIGHEIELETAGHAAEVDGIEAGYIHIVTKAPRPSTDGELVLYNTGKSFTGELNSPQELEAQGVTPPAINQYLWDMSFSLGGNIWADMIRYFANVHYTTNKSSTPFSLWTDPQGVEHEAYKWKSTDKFGFFRLTGKLSPDIKVIATATYANRAYPAYSDYMSARTAQEASVDINPEKNLLLSGWVNYRLNQNTFVNLKASYLKTDSKFLLNANGTDNPAYYDEATGYRWGRGDLNNLQKTNKFRANVTLVHINGRLLGTDQKIKLGADYDNRSSQWNNWLTDNLLVHYLNTSPYYFGMADSPTTAESVGKGKISFSLAAASAGGFYTEMDMNRLGLFVQDSITFANRLTLNLGIRFDRSMANLKETSKIISGNPISIQLGEDFIKPVANLNPYADFSPFPAWRNMIEWNTFSPRLGLSFDAMGNGRIILKAHYARYHELHRIQNLIPINPLYFARSHNFYWYDENMDGMVDDNDSYAPFPEDFRLYGNETYTQVLDEGIQSPYVDEYTLGLQGEIFRDLSLRVNYILKNKKNIIENVLYSPDLGVPWYTVDIAPESWWIPFYTTVPGTGDYEPAPVTVYFPSKEAPLSFYRLQNVPELKRQYQGLEFILHKRMSNNWQFLASVVFSNTTGNIGVGSRFRNAFSPAADNANYFVNLPNTSSLDFDIPLAIKVMGTYRFPYDFYLSAYYTHLSGYPWARSVTVMPPAAWAELENARDLPARVLLETPGTRRHDPFRQLNLRIEKEFPLRRFGSFAVSLDIMNTLGNTYFFMDMNDGGYWLPEDEGDAEGTRIISPTYDTGINLLGTREYRLTFRLRF
jgi:hypothetical protein